MRTSRRGNLTRRAFSREKAQKNAKSETKMMKDIMGLCDIVRQTAFDIISIFAPFRG
jgi:hypothetical protein